MKLIKRYSAIITATVLVSQAFGQQLPLSHQSLFNPYQFNPAYAGIDAAEGFIGLRQQWVGIEGAPLTRSFNVSTPIFGNMGIGGGVYTYDIGFSQQFHGRMSYAYGVKLNDDMDLRFGVDALVQQHTLAVSQLTEDLIDDPIILGGSDVSGVAFDAAVGVHFRWTDLQVGIAAPYLLENKLGMEEPSNVVYHHMKRHLQANVQYRYEIVEDEWAVQPMVVVRQEFNTPTVFDAGVMGEWKNTLWLAAMYRKQTNLAFGAGANFTGRFKFGYFFELPTSKVSAHTLGSHEFFMGIKFGRTHEDKEADKNEIISAVEENQTSMRNDVDAQMEDVKKAIEDLKKAQEASDAKYEKALEEKNKEIEELKKAIGGGAEGGEGAEGQGGEGAQGGKSGASTPGSSKIGEDEQLQKVEKSGSGEAVMSELDAGFYVVIGSYKDNRWAEHHASELAEQGVNALIVHNPSRGFYYMFLEKLGNLDAALTKMEEVRSENYPEAWVHVYDPKKANK